MVELGPASAHRARRSVSARHGDDVHRAVFVSQRRTLLLAHTGDSRAYLLRDGAAHRADPRRLVRAGTRRPRDLIAPRGRGLPSASQHHHGIAAAASEDERRSHVTGRATRPGDRWLLCSDGVIRLPARRRPGTIVLIAHRERRVRRADALVALALGGRDPRQRDSCRMRCRSCDARSRTRQPRILRGRGG